MGITDSAFPHKLKYTMRNASPTYLGLSNVKTFKSLQSLDKKTSHDLPKPHSKPPNKSNLMSKTNYHGFMNFNSTQNLKKNSSGLLRPSTCNGLKSLVTNDKETQKMTDFYCTKPLSVL